MPLASLALVRARVRNAISVEMDDQSCVVLALAAACVDRDALIEYITEKPVTDQAIRAAPEIQMTIDEFCEAFGADSAFRPNNAMRALAQSEELSAFHGQLTSTLTSTLRESSIHTRLKTNLLTRAATHAALHRLDDPIKCVEAVLGGFVLSDARRVEDLASHLESEVDLIALRASLKALASVAV